MGSQIVFVVVVLLLSVSVQFLTALEDCPDNKDYKYVVDQLFGRSTRRKRQVSINYLIVHFVKNYCCEP